ncbi:hypothetical protein ACFYP4_33190 [Streptomyces sp. NPDC005551]|uniref:hypothetical protein n=1 Tax=Streptomyces sp. NPDC005551 TaxID=3364725 RepID=UPI0036C3AEC6
MTTTTTAAGTTGTGTGTATTAATATDEVRAGAYPLVDTEWGEDPLDGVPRELRERTGSMDQDTAGGCG